MPRFRGDSPEPGREKARGREGRRAWGRREMSFQQTFTRSTASTRPSSRQTVTHSSSLHGAGTASFRQLAAGRAGAPIVPHHIRFGASADDARIDHSPFTSSFLDLFDRLGLSEIALEPLAGRLSRVTSGNRAPQRVTGSRARARSGCGRQASHRRLLQHSGREVVPIHGRPSISRASDAPRPSSWAKGVPGVGVSPGSGGRPTTGSGGGCTGWRCRRSSGATRQADPVEQAPLGALQARGEILPGVRHLLFDESAVGANRRLHERRVAS